MDVVTNSFCAGGNFLGDGRMLNVGGNQGITTNGDTPSGEDTPVANGAFFCNSNHDFHFRIVLARRSIKSDEFLMIFVCSFLAFLSLQVVLPIMTSMVDKRKSLSLLLDHVSAIFFFFSKHPLTFPLVLAFVSLPLATTDLANG